MAAAQAGGTYSLPIPGGHDIWLFNDTFLGPVNADESLPSTAGFIHNSAVLTSPRADRIETFVTRGTRQDPQSLVGPTNSPPTPAAPHPTGTGTPTGPSTRGTCTSVPGW